MKLEEVMRRAGIWRAGELPADAGMPTGFAALDSLLPGGGWPRAGLTEILAAAPGIGAVRLVLPALARLTRAGHWVIWVAPPHIPYAPALNAHGLDLGRVLVVELPDAADGAGETLWAYEQALRFADCAAALYWVDELAHLRLRRLQLAAETGRTWGILFRPQRCATLPSPAPFRIALEACTDAGAPVAARLQVTLLKARGAHGGARCLLEL
jgi:hypothetical protein